MKTKVIALLLAVLAVMAVLTGCVQSNVGVKLNADETGSVSTTIGIEKEFYARYLAEANPFEGKETSEYKSDGKTYIAYTELKEYTSFEDVEKALLEMTYQTDGFDAMENTADTDTETAPETEAPVTIQTDNHVFKSVDIQKKSGIFYNAYSFKAVMNPQKDDAGFNIDDAFKVTFTLEMPSAITEASGGTVDGNKVTFDIESLAEETELAASSEATNIGVIIGIVVVLTVLLVVLFLLFRRKDND